MFGINQITDDESREMTDEEAEKSLACIISIDDDGILSVTGEYCGGSFHKDSKRKLYEYLKQEYERV